MDYKEKYEMALETIQEILDSGEDSIKMSRLKVRLQSVFLELKESEGEKIRKALLELVHDTTGDELLGNYKVYKEEAIAWLEKQGEKKPTDKVEPKFKESMTDYERGYIDGRKAMAEKIQIILNAI